MSKREMRAMVSGCRNRRASSSFTATDGSLLSSIELLLHDCHNPNQRDKQPNEYQTAKPIHGRNLLLAGFANILERPQQKLFRGPCVEHAPISTRLGGKNPTETLILVEFPFPARRLLEQLVDDSVGRDPFRRGREVRQQPVPE